MSKSILKDKSFLFAIRVVNLYKVITETKKEFVMINKFIEAAQLLEH